MHLIWHNGFLGNIIEGNKDRVKLLRSNKGKGCVRSWQELEARALIRVLMLGDYSTDKILASF